MADDQTQRSYRPNEAPARGRASATGSDPLAELARLIGQTDPFAEFGRQNARRPAPPPSAPPPSFGQADYFDAPSAPPSRPTPLQPPPFVPPTAPRQPYAADGFPPHGGAHPAGAPPGFETDPYHSGDAGHPLDDAAYYEDPPQPKRRMGILAIAAVFALAVIGTAGAFGYRAIFGGSRSSAPPPVIKADTAPSKIVPAAASKTPNKLITDRVGDQAQGERLVSREEKPVTITTVEVKNKPALATVPPPQGNGQQAMAQPAPGSGVISTEPKKVHTIVIHPDQMGNGQQAPVAAAPPPMPPAPARTAAPPPPPAMNNPPPAASAAPAPPPHPAEARAAAPAHGNAPLSLSPDAPPSRPMRTAAAAAPAPAPQATHSGGYAVQVSSQRTEAEAQAAFRGLQAKYPKILGDRQPLIHKVELGAKGTYYRAMVGPFANANEATELCNGLRAAGGQCLIQRN